MSTRPLTLALRPLRLSDVIVRAHPTSRARSLGASCRRQISFSAAVDGCCLAAHDALTALHSTTGLPWVVTLPLAAFLVRAAFVLPLEVWSRHHRRKAALARPLLSAWRPILQKRTFEENVQHGPNVTHKVLLQAMRAKRKEIYRRLGVRTSPAFAPFLQLPVFLVTIETIRKMCGTKEGLLGLVTKSISGSDESATTADEMALSAIPLEDSLATEGGLWFTDLLAPDPQLILPFALSAVLFANVELSKRQLASEGVEPSKASTRMSRVIQLVALAAGPITLSVPSAMLVYWVSSSASAMLMHIVLWKAMPNPSTAISVEADLKQTARR